MKIVIPSYKRSGKLVFDKWIPESFYKNVYVVIREEESKLYSHLENKVNLICLSNIEGIHDKRYEITKIFKNEKIWMVDDDVIVHGTYNDDGWRRIHENPISENEFYSLIEETAELLDRFPYGVVRTKGPFRFSFTMPEIELNTWNYTNTFLNLKTLDADFLGYNQVYHGEDIWAFCSVHKGGYETFCYNKCFSVSPSPSKKLESGGMSHIRKGKLMSDSHKKIVENFPEYVKLKAPKKQLGFLDKDDEIPMMTSIKIKKRKTEKEVTNIVGFFNE